MNQTFWLLFSLFASGVVACTLGGFLARSDWRLEILSHFRLQYFFLLAISCFTFLIYGRFFAGILFGAFSAVNLSLILPLYRKQDSEPPIGQVYRLLLSNVKQTNRAYHKVKDVILSSQADFVVLIEVNQGWMSALAPLLDTYPACFKGLREDEYGVAILSRIPFNHTETVALEGTDLPAILVSIDLERSELRLVATHPPPPKNRRMAERRNRHFQEIARLISALRGNLIFAADLNTTSWSPFFHDLLERSGLQDSRQGFGVQPTWPAGNPFFRIPIDHVLVSSQIRIVRRSIGPGVGSDHYPVLVDFSLNLGTS